MNRLIDLGSSFSKRNEMMVKRNEFVYLLLVFLLGFGVVLSRTLSSEEKLFAREFVSNLFELRDICALAPKWKLCPGNSR